MATATAWLRVVNGLMVVVRSSEMASATAWLRVEVA
jgi:hypothetical protein